MTEQNLICGDIPQKYLDKVLPIGECWYWTGSHNGVGYGEIRINNKKVYAHRYFYEQIKKVKIPDGLVIDHLCRNPCCVNPNHLEPVTTKVNVQRGNGAKQKPYMIKEYCINGHKFTEENSYWRKDGKGRNCNECVRIRAREYMRNKNKKLKHDRAESSLRR